MSKSLQQIFLLLLLIVLGNVLYWSLNNRFLHEDLLGMVLGQADTPIVSTPETLPPPAPTAAPEMPSAPPSTETMPNNLAGEASLADPNDAVELINTIAGLQAEIGALEIQADEISEIVDDLVNQAQLSSLKLDEIQASYGLSDEQLASVLAELETATPASPESTAPATAE